LGLLLAAARTLRSGANASALIPTSRRADDIATIRSVVKDRA
jgi:hypothetical protein